MNEIRLCGLLLSLVCVRELDKLNSILHGYGGLFLVSMPQLPQINDT